MKRVLCSILTIFTFILLAFVPNSFAQGGTSSERMVRVVYILPSDRRPQPDINTKLDTLVKDVQQFLRQRDGTARVRQKNFYG